MTSATPRPVRRSDAERNRDKILTAGHAAFADPQADVSMAEVSRRAGVGMATLYRNFANRRELLEAVLAAEVDAVCAAADATAGPTPGAAFTGWLRHLHAFFAGKRHVAAELLKHTDREDPVFGSSRARVAEAGRPLLAAAQRTREIRDDLDIDQVLDLVHAVAGIDASPGHVQPILQVAIDGLRPSEDHAE